ncbi:MAG: ATP-binding protein [Myxococcales bacterium]|nr:ATP-binding protein [Myxococcales bacterium]
MLYDFEFEETDAKLDFAIKLDEGKRFYCFIGENGVGKTNLLQNMARVLLASHSMFLGRKQEGVRFCEFLLFPEIQQALLNKSIPFPWGVRSNRKDVKQRSQYYWNVLEFEALKNGLRLPFLPVLDRPIVMVGARERGHTSNLPEESVRFLLSARSVFNSTFDRTFAAVEGTPRPLESVASWVTSRLLVNPMFAVGSGRREAEVIALCKSLQQLDSARFSRLVMRVDQQIRLAIAYEGGQLWFNNIPIDKLATGYIAAVKILQEIIAAFAAWGALIGHADPLTLDGIVFIDELDAHLHPKWQAKMVSLLKGTFPNATFVTATHSPTIISQTEEGEAYELVRDGNKVTSRRLGSPRDWYLSDLYATAFHLDLPQPGTAEPDADSVVSLLTEFSKIVQEYLAAGKSDAKLRDDARSLYEQAKDKLPDTDPRRKHLEVLRGMLG